MGVTAGVVIGSWAAETYVFAQATGLTLALGRAAGAMIGGAVAQKIFGKDGQSSIASESGVMLNKPANNAPIPVVYGRRRIGGTIVLMDTSGDKNENLHVVLVLCEGEVAEIERVYFNDVWIDDPRWKDKIYYPDHEAGATVNNVFAMTGSDTQSALYALTSGNMGTAGKWTADHKLSGTAYLYAYLEFDRDIHNGIPTITADVKGLKVYDPRDGGQTQSDRTTFEFSDNPALCLLDFLTADRYGRGIDYSLIDEDSFVVAADYCDEIIDHPSADYVHSSGSLELVMGAVNQVTLQQVDKEFWDTVDIGTKLTMSGWTNAENNSTAYCTHKLFHSSNGYYLWLSGDGALFPGVSEVSSSDITFSNLQLKRYYCNGAVDTSQGTIEVVKQLLTSCNGFLVFTGGKYKLIIDKPETASFTFSEDNIVGAWNISLGGKRDRFNRIRANFFNSSKNWQSDIMPVDNATVRTNNDSGLLLESMIDLPFTSNPYQAQEIATIALNRSRQSIMCEFTATIEGLRCEVGDVVYVKHSTPAWDTLNGGLGKLFRVMAIAISNTDEVTVRCVEYDVSTYSFTLNELDYSANTGLPDPRETGEIGEVKVVVHGYDAGSHIAIEFDDSGLYFRDYVNLTIEGVTGGEEAYQYIVDSTGPNTITNDGTVYRTDYRGLKYNIIGYTVKTTLTTTERDYLRVGDRIIMSGWSGINSDLFNGTTFVLNRIYDNADGTTGLKVYAMTIEQGYRSVQTSLVTASTLNITLDNTKNQRVNPSNYYENSIKLTTGNSYGIDNLPVGNYTATLTPYNMLGISGTPATININIDPPKVPDVSGLELDLGGDGEANATEWTGKDCKIKWRPASLGGSIEYFTDEEPEGIEVGGTDLYVKDYEVKVYSGSTLLRTEYVTDTWYIYTYEKNAEDAAKNSATAYRELTFHVRARGNSNQTSDTVASMTAANPAPSVASVVIDTTFNGFNVGYVIPSDNDFSGLKVYASETSGFTPGSTNLVVDTADKKFTVSGLKSDTTYYYKFTPHDVFGDGTTSSERSFTTYPYQVRDILDLSEELTMSDYGLWAAFKVPYVGDGSYVLKARMDCSIYQYDVTPSTPYSSTVTCAMRSYTFAYESSYYYGGAVASVDPESTAVYYSAGSTWYGQTVTTSGYYLEMSIIGGPALNSSTVGMNPGDFVIFGDSNGVHTPGVYIAVLAASSRMLLRAGVLLGNTGSSATYKSYTIYHNPDTPSPFATQAGLQNVSFAAYLDGSTYRIDDDPKAAYTQYSYTTDPNVYQYRWIGFGTDTVIYNNRTKVRNQKLDYELIYGSTT